MIRTILAIAVVGFASAPAFAMDDMSCADYTAMDSAGQMQTMAMMEECMMASGGMMAAPDAADAMSPEDSAMAVASTCAEHPEMMLGDAMGMMAQ
jgi:hypothetical protein